MQNGEMVKVSFKGTLKEGSQVFDDGTNVAVVVGAGYTIRGLDEALEQMKIGEKRTVEVPPEKGFGERKPDMIKVVPESEFKRHNTQPRVGMTVDADNRRGRVISITSGRVTVDFNHPLAGKTLVYEVEVKEKIESKEEQVKSLVHFFTRFDPIKVTVGGNEVEVVVPPLIHPVLKKKIADDIRKYAGIDTVKFSEIFEKPKEVVEEKKE